MVIVIVRSSPQIPVSLVTTVEEGRAIPQKTAHAAEQGRPRRYAGGTSFGGSAFGPGGISPGYRDTPWGWNKGINPNIPHPPARPEPLGLVSEVSGIEAAIGSVITGANVEAKLTGTAEGTVTGTARIEHVLTLDASGLVRRVDFIEAKLQGPTKIMNRANGPGSTGVSSPDTGSSMP